MAISMAKDVAKVHRSNATGFKQTSSDENKYILKLGRLALVAIFVSSVVVPFNIGIAISNIEGIAQFRNALTGTKVDRGRSLSLPPIVSRNKPESVYTSKQFDYSSNEFASQPSGTVLSQSAQEKQCIDDESKNTSDYADMGESASSIHQPTGQHLLIDVENVDPEFLSSPNRLAQSLVDLVEQTTLTMLSYHCHGNQKGGFTCVGVLLESHVSLHTWPVAGDIFLDLFTCGNSPLLPIIDIIRSLFAIASPDGPSPNVNWGHKRRGFRLGDGINLEDFDYHNTLGDIQTPKDHIIEEATNFQHVAILDVGVNSGSQRKDRLLYLDSVLQSRRYGDAAYHEALVHPTLMTHENPKRVAIIGGGEGATLREVLKHKTVEEVVMIEIDEELVNLCREHLPEWSYCGNIEGSTSSCFDDPRTAVYYEDAVGWFLERYSADDDVDEASRFDVIIMDSLDPNSAVDFSDVLFGTSSLINAFSYALGDNGVFVAQVGEADSFDDPVWEAKTVDNENEEDVLSVFIDLLEIAGFQSVTQYDEAHGGFAAPWDFLVALKNSTHRSTWYMNEAEMQLEIHERISRAIDGSPILRFFDGATFMGYQFPSRIVENSWCKRYPDECEEGHGFDPEINDIPPSAYEVIISQVANGGRGVATKQFIKKGTYLGIESCVNGIFVPSLALDKIEDSSASFRENSRFWDTLLEGYIDGYGWLDNQYGLPAAGIEPSLWSFVNHGCNGTYSIGTPLDVTELTVDTEAEPDAYYSDENDLFNPFVDRHFPSWGCSEFVALRDIQAGEELFDNYLVFGGSDPDDWKHNAKELQSICSGGLGRITAYEAESQK